MYPHPELEISPPKLCADSADEDSHLLVLIISTYSQSFMKIQLVPRGNVIPIWFLVDLVGHPARGHRHLGWDAIRIDDRLHGGGTHRLDLQNHGRSGISMDIIGKQIEKLALDNSIVEAWCVKLFWAPTATCAVRNHPWEDREGDRNNQVWWFPTNVYVDGTNLRSEKWAGLMIFRSKVFILMPR